MGLWERIAQEAGTDHLSSHAFFDVLELRARHSGGALGGLAITSAQFDNAISNRFAFDAADDADWVLLKAAAVAWPAGPEDFAAVFRAVASAVSARPKLLTKAQAKAILGL